ncbi:hypothetical protein C7C46_17625 [Streptomyces tateyamensis]|uniref:Lecithin:cholesterol acyltransferase n=1 Tax=Streptomyces tateyamensis TaxID=565073 RepID=A0A2V4P4K1_9ACTN|nr:hypothetical protein [Streptomyces tateyamensis]PYC77800.1 hypothetical protein C7C46_17625 [Streptomyces tateyamensis]
MGRRERVTDLVVVLPGITGSRLYDVGGREVWGRSGSTLLRGIASFGAAVQGLTLPSGLGDGPAPDGVTARGLVPDLHALPGVSNLVDGYTDLLGWLEQSFTLELGANLLAFGYDWRLSCRYNAGRLKSVVERALEEWRASAVERRTAKLVFVCHSMGGLIARHYVACGGGAELTRQLITLGTPHRGALDALGHLMGGMRKFGLDLTAFARSLPSLHQLTPDYACLGAGELSYARELPGLPGIDAELLHDAGQFHAEIRSGVQTGYEFRPVVGIHQATPTTALVEDGGLVLLDSIKDLDEGGDGRVPRLSAGAAGTAFTPVDKHGALQNNPGVRDALLGWLAAEPPSHRAAEGPAVALRVRAPELLRAGEPCELAVEADADQDSLRVRVSVDGGQEHTLGSGGGGRYFLGLGELAPGAHRVVVRAEGRAGAVTSMVLVMPRER